MQYIPCNSALLTKEKLFLTQKGPFFVQNVRKSRQIFTCNKIKFGLKIFARVQTFGGGPPRPPTTSAILVQVFLRCQ